jgi:pimeloyl-ACP methyl ester carboxylesterase
MDGSGTLFFPFLRELPDWVTPLVVSYPPDQPLDYPGHLEIVMAALPTDRPFVLLGESFSGPLALIAAAQNPSGLRGVILCATFVTWPLLLPPVFARLAVALGAFRLKSNRLFHRLVFGLADEKLRLLSFTALACLTPTVLAARARAVMTVDCTRELRECPVPLLVLVADHDRIVARRNSGLIQQIRSDAKLLHFNAPHLILQCATIEACQQIGLFLGELRDDSRRIKH